MKVDRLKVLSEPAAETTQKYLVRLSFSGLCAFVPRGQDESKLERMDVLLVNPIFFERCVDPHRATLKFYLKNLRGAEQNGDLDKTQGAWSLHDEDLEMLLVDRETGTRMPLPAPVRLREGRKFPDKPRPDYEIEDPEERRRDLERQASDFSWLPEISEALDERAGIVDAYFLDGVNPSLGLSARFRVSGGFWGTLELAKFLDDAVVSQFVPAVQEERPYVQAMAQKICMDVEIEGKYDVVLQTTPWTSGVPRDLTLRAAPGEILEIDVFNFCDCSYDQQRGYSRYIEQDVDYRFHYHLSARYSELKAEFPHVPIPVAVRYRASSRDVPNSGGVAPIRCSGTAFQVTPMVGNLESSTGMIEILELRRALK